MLQNRASYSHPSVNLGNRMSRHALSKIHQEYTRKAMQSLALALAADTNTKADYQLAEAYRTLRAVMLARKSN